MSDSQYAKRLNQLLSKHIAAQKRFEKVLPYTDSLRLSNLYQRGQKRHGKMASAIRTEMRRLGYEPNDPPYSSSAAPPPWKERHPMLSKQKSKATLGACIRGESKCLEAYKAVLKNLELPTSSKALLRNQCEAMELSMLNLRTEEIAVGLRG